MKDKMMKGSKGSMTNNPSGSHADNGGWTPRVKGMDKSTSSKGKKR